MAQPASNSTPAVLPTDLLKALEETVWMDRSQNPTVQKTLHNEGGMCTHLGDLISKRMPRETFFSIHVEDVSHSFGASRESVQARRIEFQIDPLIDPIAAFSRFISKRVSEGGFFSKSEDRRVNKSLLELQLLTHIATSCTTQEKETSEIDFAYSKGSSIQVIFGSNGQIETNLTT